MSPHMLVSRLAVPALLASLPLAPLACTRTAPAPSVGNGLAASSAIPDDSPYVTITPEVSLSEGARDVEQRAANEPSPDVMAEILAIPPGR